VRDAGKLNRGTSVIDSLSLLNGGDEELSDEDVIRACALGWCIEWLQAYFLVEDDIMDNSVTRRGQPCWYRVPKVNLCSDKHCFVHFLKLLHNIFLIIILTSVMQEDFLFPFLLCLLTSKLFYVQVGLIAINDGIVLRTHISRILKTHFRKLPIYTQLLEIFNEVEYQTASGQMLDLITTPAGEVDLSKYVLPTYVI
jgi:farnesyl diphosphate synthase